MITLTINCAPVSTEEPRRTFGSMTTSAIGIGFGTSNSCVAVFQFDKVECIANDQGNRTTPSYVAFTESEILTGEAAKVSASANPVVPCYRFFCVVE